MGDLPLLIGGGGEQVTLRIVAEHADMWNGFGPLEAWSRRSRTLDEWCARVGRDPAAIERTVLLSTRDIEQTEAFLEAGADHVMVQTAHPSTSKRHRARSSWSAPDGRGWPWLCAVRRRASRTEWDAELDLGTAAR